MEKLDALIGRIETAVQKWLSDLEAHPLKTGFKTLLILYVLRWVRREFFS